jgi:hypothetical protein
MNKKRNLLILLGAVLSLLVFVATEVLAMDPCCSITGVDHRAGMVTAQNTATGQSFQFKVNNSAVLKTLKVDQGVYADFGTKEVSVDGVEPCCSMVNLSAPVKGLGR